MLRLRVVQVRRKNSNNAYSSTDREQWALSACLRLFALLVFKSTNLWAVWTKQRAIDFASRLKSTTTKE